MGVLLDALGIDGESIRFVVLVEDRIGIMAEVSRILKEEQINIRSLITWPEKAHPGIYQIVLRVGAANGEKAIIDDLTPYLPGV
jgi:acetoin utilization protein AcuB